MNRFTCKKGKTIALVIVALAILVGGLYSQFALRESRLHILQLNQYTTFYIDENGNAIGEWIYEIPPSYLADQVRLTITGGTFGDFHLRGMGVENAKSMYSAIVRGSFAKYAIEMENISCDITGFSAGEPFKIRMRWKTPHLAGRHENKWRIFPQPVDRESFARGFINDMKSLQATLSVLSKMARKNFQLSFSSKTSFILPPGAVIDNELLGFTTSIDYGGGSKGTITIYTREIGGRPAAVEEGRSMITQRLITMKPEEFMEVFPLYHIDYSGIQLTYGFEESASWAASEMKFGRERDEYSVSFNGLELNILPHQFLYYCARMVVILAENGGILLVDTEPISILPPENESGEWDAFLKLLDKDGYLALARAVLDRIESSGRVPGTISSPIGNIRSRDALFTFLRIISFYNKRGKLPENLLFVPAPTGNLVRNGDEVPASHSYYLLGTQYVITDTERVNRIVSSMRQLGYENGWLAKKLCEWVYENITYPRMPTLGWFTSEEVLDTREGKCLDKANLYLALLRTAGFPARRVDGFLIFEQIAYPFTEIAGITPEGDFMLGHAWAEVYLPLEGWVFADPTGNLFRTHEYKIYSSVEETWQEVLASYETTYGQLT